MKVYVVTDHIWQTVKSVYSSPPSQNEISVWDDVTEFELLDVPGIRPNTLQHEGVIGVDGGKAQGGRT